VVPQLLSPLFPGNRLLFLKARDLNGLQINLAGFKQQALDVASRVSRGVQPLWSHPNRENDFQSRGEIVFTNDSTIFVAKAAYGKDQGMLPLLPQTATKKIFGSDYANQILQCW